MRVCVCVCVTTWVCVCVFVTMCVCLSCVGLNPNQLSRERPNNQRPPTHPTIIIGISRPSWNNLHRSTTMGCSPNEFLTLGTCTYFQSTLERPPVKMSRRGRNEESQQLRIYSKQVVSSREEQQTKGRQEERQFDHQLSSQMTTDCQMYREQASFSRQTSQVLPTAAKATVSAVRTAAAAGELLKYVSAWANSQQSESAQLDFDQCSTTDWQPIMENLPKLMPKIHNFHVYSLTSLIKRSNRILQGGYVHLWIFLSEMRHLVSDEAVSRNFQVLNIYSAHCTAQAVFHLFKWQRSLSPPPTPEWQLMLPPAINYQPKASLVHPFKWHIQRLLPLPLYSWVAVGANGHKLPIYLCISISTSYFQATYSDCSPPTPEWQLVPMAIN